MHGASGMPRKKLPRNDSDTISLRHFSLDNEWYYDIKHTYRYVIITSAGYRGDPGKCLGLGGDCHVKQDPVHGSGVLQLDLPLQCLHILLQFCIEYYCIEPISPSPFFTAVVDVCIVLLHDKLLFCDKVFVLRGMSHYRPNSQAGRWR